MLKGNLLLIKFQGVFQALQGFGEVHFVQIILAVTSTKDDEVSLTSHLYALRVQLRSKALDHKISLSSLQTGFGFSCYLCFRKENGDVRDFGIDRLVGLTGNSE